MKNMKNLALVFLGLATSIPTFATVDDLIDYTIIHRQIQTDDLCYKTLPMWAEIGIPVASQMAATMAPTRIFKQNSLGSSYVNINEISRAQGIKAEYVNDTYDEQTGVYTYSMRLDVTDHPARGDTSLKARQTIVDQAKYVLLAMNKNLAQYYPGKYRLWFTVEGLPSQVGLTGTVLPAKTQYPYTAQSTLKAAFEKELINVGGSCR